MWIDAAEEAYAETALSLEYRKAYGAMVNAQMQLRASLQAIVEQTAGALGLPGRVELDSAHRKIAELERQLRRMQRKAKDGVAGPAATKPAARKAASPKRAPVKPTKPAARKAAKPPAKKAAKASARKPASRKR